MGPLTLLAAGRSLQRIRRLVRFGLKGNSEQAGQDVQLLVQALSKHPSLMKLKWG